MIMESENFKMRCYRKSELALLYFPETKVKSAERRLMRWIEKCGELTEALLAVNYNPRCQVLSVREIRLIVAYLGEPG